MASKCPKCHQTLDEDIVCCAELEYTWKCKACGKLSQGFVVPYGRCHLCGGENEIVKGYDDADPGLLGIVQTALRFEIDMFYFYEIARKRTSNEQLRLVLEELSLKEKDHLEELDAKYHVHLDPDIRDIPSYRADIVAQWIFEGIDFNDRSHVVAIYDKALAMERRTRDHFFACADSLEPGPEQEIYRELAAEEEEHVAVLETERAQFEEE